MKTGLPLEEVTIAEALRPSGYATASIGKWHLGAAGMGPQNQGFDVSTGGNHLGLTRDYFYPGWRTARSGGARAAAVAARLGVSDPSAGIPLEGRPGEYLTDCLTQEAAAFIRANRTRPFFLLLSHYAVHIPLQAKQEIISRYEGRQEGSSPHRNPVYAAMLESVDESVGEVMRTLEDCGIAEKTVIVFTSDNGGLLTPQPPSGLPPTSNSRSGKARDIFTKGASGHGGWKREALYWHWPHYAIPGAEPASAVRQGRYKLIEFLEDGRVELYDLAKDIGERQDLARALPEKAASMLSMLRRWKESVGAQAMHPNPDFKQ